MKQWPSLQTTVVSLLTLAALLFLARELATLTWLVVAPAPVAPAVHARQTVSGLQAASALFGTAGQSLASAEPLARSSDLTLLGIVAAEHGQESYALLRLQDGSVVAVVEGQQVLPGLSLITVGIDRLVLERAGLRESLLWPLQ